MKRNDQNVSIKTLLNKALYLHSNYCDNLDVIKAFAYLIVVCKSSYEMSSE